MPRLIDSYTRTGAIVFAINDILVTHFRRDAAQTTGSLADHEGALQRVDVDQHVEPSEHEVFPRLDERSSNRGVARAFDQAGWHHPAGTREE